MAGEGSWSLGGGTGMFKNLKRKGTYKAKIAADDTAAPGAQYTLPAAKK